MKKVIAKTAAGRPLILYLVRHEDGREITVHGRNKYEAVTAPLASGACRGQA
jgi:hypothetical protein